MDKVKIQEIAAEAGLSNTVLLGKAKELGFNVKVANSSISMEQAGILVDYAISGTLPSGYKKPTQKSKITMVKKIRKVEKPKPAVAEKPEEIKEEVIAEVKKESIPVEAPKIAPAKDVETPKEEPSAEEAIAPEVKKLFLKREKVSQLFLVKK